jgi:hypothetical protein
MPPKSVFLSKTLIVNAVVAVSALYPPAAHWVSTHAGLTLQLIVYANLALRLVTKSKLTLFP